MPHKTATHTALITGASKGIGAELARLLAADGYNTILVARNEEKLAALGCELEKRYGIATSYIPCDLSAPDAVGTLVATVRSQNTHVDVLVNAAGFGYDAPFATSDSARQHELVQTNVMALTELCCAFVPDMAKRREGGILNIASVAGFMPGPGMATYYASKAYVQSLSQALHIELRVSGVKVCALCPGPVRTDFWNTADAGHTALAHVTLPVSFVARMAYLAFKMNKSLCIPGLLPKAAVFITRLLPRGLMARIAGVLQIPTRS